MRRKRGLQPVDGSETTASALKRIARQLASLSECSTSDAADALASLDGGDAGGMILLSGKTTRETWEVLVEARRLGYDLPLILLRSPMPKDANEPGAGAAEDATAPRPLPTTYYDPLTGLPNKSLFTQWLTRAVGRAKRQPGYRFAVLLLDLDRFQMVNDSLGRALGDELLEAVARRLMTHLRFSDAVARLSGDEFTILIDDIEEVSDAVRIAHRVHKALEKPFRIGGQEVFPTVSIGIALSATGYDRPEEMIQDAETAMRKAKSTEEGLEIFDPEMRQRARDALRLETDLRRAIERAEFRLHYQPIFSLKHREVIGFEALLRWQHPTRGFVSPGEFIPAAEQSGQIVAIGEWVLREACSQMKRWREQLPLARNLFINVNLSRKQLIECDLVTKVDRTLRQTGLAAEALHLEITESMVMENASSAIDTLVRLRSLGVQVCIDDFGTGYSSLSCLHRLPIQTIKIDRSFVSRMGLDVESSEIVRTIVSLARNLGKQVVAEGVETEDQLSRIEALGCDHAQGFLFSKPVPAEDARALIGTELGVGAPA